MSKAILDLLNNLRVRSTAYIGKNLAAPWGVNIEAYENLARFHILVSGSTYIGLGKGSDAQKLEAGDVAIILNGKSHFYSDKANRSLKPANFPTGPDNSYFHQYDSESKNTHLLCGYFEISRTTPPAIFSCLPDLLIGRAKDSRISRKFDLITGLIAEELSNPAEQSQANLNRLTEILCIYTIEDWAERNFTEDQSLHALADAKTRTVLDNIHDNPAAPWTVEKLAADFGKSRTAFATHFKKATGMSPMNYVRRWRISLACDMLEQNALSIDEIAFHSGYADTNAFNRAFKRETGTSPGAYKRIALPK